MRMPRGGGSFRTQLMLLTSVVTAFGVVVLTVVVQVVLARSATSGLDTVLTDRAEAVIGSASTDPRERLRVPDDRLDAGVAVYDGAGDLVAGSVPSSAADVYGSLSTTTERRTVDLDGADQSRIRAEPFTVGGATGVVVVIERLAPYERAERQALLVCVGAGVLMILAAAGLAQWVSRQALAPVALMSRAAKEWSEHDLAHRFDLGPGGNEIASLGRTLDHLLGRVAGAIRSEQRLTAELAHELRTPLSAIQANAALALLDPRIPVETRESLEEVVAAARRMGETMQSLLDLARTGSARTGGEACLLRETVEDAVTALGADPGVEITVAPDLRVLVPPQLAVRVLSPVLDNAGRLGHRVVVSAERRPSGLTEVWVDDDGPGIAEADRERVFAPGHTTGDGAGLGLALSRRVARSLGGDVRVADGPLATRIVVSLPSG